MSIINDALKKTQSKFKKKDKASEQSQGSQDEKNTANVYEKMYQAQKGGQAAQASGRRSARPTSSRTSSAAPRKAKKWLKTMSTGIFCLLVIGGGFFLATRYKPVQNFIRSRGKSIPPSRALIAGHIPKKRTYRSTELVLNGTSFVDGKKVALINDEIYEIGDIINGKKIIRIDINRVELQDKEGVVALRTH